MAHGVDFSHIHALANFISPTIWVDVRFALAHLEGESLRIYVSPREPKKGEPITEKTGVLLGEDLFATWKSCDPRRMPVPEPHFHLTFADDCKVRLPESRLNLFVANPDDLERKVFELITAGGGFARFLLALDEYEVSGADIIAGKVTLAEFKTE